jgi:hypothetical protein
MAFTTTQTIDSVLTRNFNFRLNNNAPISSLYTLYANGAGQTYWSNSINTNDLSTLSTAIGFTNNTVAIQSTQINTLFVNTSNLSTYLSTVVYETVSTANSTVYGLSSVLGYAADVTEVKVGLSTVYANLSTQISVQNTSSYSTLTRNYNTAIAAASVSTFNASRVLTGASASSLAGFFSSALISTTGGLTTAQQSTSAGLQRSISTLGGAVSTNFRLFSTFQSQTNFNFASTNSRLWAIEFISSGSVFSTNLSSLMGRNISSAVGTSQAQLNSTFNVLFRDLSSIVSTINISTLGFLSSIASISTTTGGAISTLNSTVSGHTEQIADLTYEFSVITTSSILAGIYDTFIALEGYTSTLIGSTIEQTNSFTSSFYVSTSIANISIQNAFYNSVAQVVVSSAIAFSLPSTFQYMSSLVSSLYSTGIYDVTTALGSTAQSSILGYISTPAGISLSTVSGSTVATYNSYVTSTLNEYNAFVDSLTYAASTYGVSSLYTNATLNLTSNTYTANLDLLSFRNFYVNIYGLQTTTNSNYRITYNPSTTTNLNYNRGVITLNVSTPTYAGGNHALMFNTNRWGFPTTVFNATFPGIMGYTYEAQYEYTIINQALYTNLLNIMPRIEMNNVTVAATPTVFSSNTGQILSTTYWYGTPITFNWSNYMGLPTTGYGGPPFDPRVVVDVYDGSNFLTEYGPTSLSNNVLTISTPSVVGKSAGALRARIYIEGLETRTAYEYNFTAVNSVFDTLVLSNTCNSPNGYNFLLGNELVLHTVSGKYPLKGVVPGVTTTGSASKFLSNDATYSFSNMTNGTLNVIGNGLSPFTLTTTTAYPPLSSPQQVYQSNSVFLPPNDTQLIWTAFPLQSTFSTFDTLNTMGNLSWNYIIHNQASTIILNLKNAITVGNSVSSIVYANLFGNVTSYPDSYNLVLSTNSTLMYLNADFNLPTVVPSYLFGVPVQQNFIGPIYQNVGGTDYSYAQTMTFSNIGLNSTFDSVREIGFYNVYDNGSGVPIPGCNMSNNTMTARVTAGTTTYYSTFVFDGSDTQVFRFGV